MSAWPNHDTETCHSLREELDQLRKRAEEMERTSGHCGELFVDWIADGRAAIAKQLREEIARRESEGK